ncbi:MAG: Hsp70 family protein, partial [Planctomycetia bacterium]
RNETIVVFDLGGGTFDITVMRIRDGLFDVLATNGDTRLGGDDFDLALIDYAAEHFRGETGIDPRNDPMALQRLQEAVEKAKRELTSQPQTDLNLPYIAADSFGPKHLQLTISRAQFEQMTAGLYDRMRQPCLQALADAKIKSSEINEVVLVGGATRMPKVRDLAKEIFGREPFKGINPDEAVAVGAAVQAGMLDGKFEEFLLLDVTPLSLGLETRGGLFTRLIDRNTTVPCIKREIFTTARDGQQEVGLHVLQGERDQAAHNRTLGKFWLEGIRPAPAGVPQIEVTFSINANGILSVAAKDLDTGLERSIKVESSSGLSPADIERMKAEAEQAREEDKKRRDLEEVRQSADAAVFEAEKYMRDESRKLSGERTTKLKAAVEKVKQVLKNGEASAVTGAVWELRQQVKGH